MAKAQKNRASKQVYHSPLQMTLEGFESPFDKKLIRQNRWVILSKQIPWDTLVCQYTSQMNNSKTGADGINPRVAIGAMIIKHMCNLSDRETVLQIQENMYMQYFIGYSSFSNEEPFDPSLFVDFRKRLGIEQINKINEQILKIAQKKEEDRDKEQSKGNNFGGTSESNEETQKPPSHKGQLITDATACPQDIRYPTDLDLLNDSREKAEELIDVLFTAGKQGVKPRTYREKARKDYLKTAQKKNKSKKEVRKAIRKQLSYLKRNIGIINKLLDGYSAIPLDKHQYKYLLVIQTLFNQQQKMYNEKTHSVEDRIVSIHQPHVRPIVRGKSNAYVEFGAKINVSMMNGFAFLDDLSWDAFNEGTRLIGSVEKYRERFGYYPKEVLADKIYCNRANRAKLKELDIRLKAKPLGRPKKAVSVEHVSPGERNPIEGKFGQAKTAYGMNRIKARLQQTSESWIATIVMVLNLVKLAGKIPYYLWLGILTLTAKGINIILENLNKKISELQREIFNPVLLT